jgi:hypothetical protein
MAGLSREMDFDRAAPRDAHPLTRHISIDHLHCLDPPKLENRVLLLATQSKFITPRHSPWPGLVKSRGITRQHSCIILVRSRMYDHNV